MTNINFKYYLIIVILTLNSSCKSIELTDPTDLIVKCPQKSDSLLRPENLQFVSLVNNEMIQLTNTANQDPVGYQFFGEKGQTLEHETEQDLCIWIYSPDNQLLESNNLPMTGNYIIQISSLQPQDFQLSLGLDINNTANNNSSPNPFASQNFPQSSCGDSKPTDPALSSVNFYPVNLPYSSEKLSIAQDNFCRDAYRKRDKNTGQITIQISSFTDQRKAQQFADFIGDRLSGAYVGEPTTIYLNN